MFTGIVERSAPVVGVTDGPMFRRLTLAVDWTDLKRGESIAVNGVCLTVADLGAPDGHPGLRNVAFDVITETLSKTNLGLLKAGDHAHVERALRVNDRIDGHFVQGHVDATAPLLSRTFNEKEYRLTLECPSHLAKYLIPKGSVAIDGVSLTVASLDGTRFDVALIPTTLNITELGNRPEGWPFNLEADMLSKTIVTYLERMGR